MTHLEVVEIMKQQDRRYRRWIWERRLRRWGPLAFSAAVAVVVFWLVRRI